jgi:TatD DNase family protein
MARWLDAHTHLDADELFSEKEKVLDRAQKAGVNRILLVNSEATEPSFERTLECLQVSHPVQRSACFAIHPHQAILYNRDLEERLTELLAVKNVVALGECGLDFYYNYSPQDVQVTAFLRQAHLSKEKKLPLVIHCRDAYPQLAEILREVDQNWRGMIHCFTGTMQEMEPLLELGFYISFSGIVTFPKARTLQECAKNVPLNRILIETDAPYLSPVPHRGKRNEPSYVIETGKFIASLREISNEQFTTALQENYDALFRLTVSS